VTSSFAWNQSEQVNDHSSSAVMVRRCRSFPLQALEVPRRMPPFAGNIRARYEFTLGNYNAYAQVAGQHTDHSYASVITKGLRTAESEPGAYSTYDAALGATKDSWTWSSMARISRIRGRSSM